MLTFLIEYVKVKSTSFKINLQVKEYIFPIYGIVTFTKKNNCIRSFIYILNISYNYDENKYLYVLCVLIETFSYIKKAYSLHAATSSFLQ